MYLLEQAAVSCAAIIHTHTAKEINKEEIEDAQALLSSSPSPSPSPTDGVRELEEVEEVGRALETARLLLGVAGRLLPSLIRTLDLDLNGVGEGERQGRTGIFHRGSDYNIAPLVISSAHFLTSLLGNWQAEVPQGNGPQQGDRSVALRSLEQHSSRHYLHPSVPMDGITATANTVSGSLNKPQGGVGLLQSCVMYAQYVRTSSARQHLDRDIAQENTGIDGNTGSLDDVKAEAGVEREAKERSKEVVKESKVQGQKKQYQFAALHHLESKILSFIEASFKDPLIMTLHQSVTRSAGMSASDCSNESSDNGLISHGDRGDEGVTSMFYQWLSKERSASILLLLSSSLSYYRFKSDALALTGARVHDCVCVRVQRAVHTRHPAICLSSVYLFGRPFVCLFVCLLIDLIQ